jgi:hypothetical protein
MTIPTTAGPHLGGQLHTLLLHLAGRVPDDLMTESRAWLAAGQHTDVAQALAFGLAAGAIPIEPADVEVLTTVLTEAGAGTEILDDVPRGPTNSYPPYTMAPVAPEILAEQGDAVPACLDLTGTYPTPWGADPLDQAAADTATAVAADSGQLRLVGLWRAWRYPANQSPWPEPKRIYLVEAGSEVPADKLPAVAGRFQNALLGAGEPDPQVEVVVAGGDEPAYQLWVRGYGALLWALNPTAPLHVARAFDRVDPRTGPAFEADHLVLDGEEQTTVVRYLEAGEAVLTTGIRLPDLVDPTRGEVVPINLFTDGRWIWAETTTYYLKRYGIAPDPDLLTYLRAHGSELPAVDSVGLHLATVALQSSGRDPVWVP